LGRRASAAGGILPDQSRVLAAWGAGLVLAFAGSKASGVEHRRTYALALRIIARTTGKTRIRRRSGKSLPDAAGFRGRRTDQRNQKLSAQDPLQLQPPRLTDAGEHFAHCSWFTLQGADRARCSPTTHAYGPS